MHSLRSVSRIPVGIKVLLGVLSVGVLAGCADNSRITTFNPNNSNGVTANQYVGKASPAAPPLSSNSASSAGGGMAKIYAEKMKSDPQHIPNAR